MPLNSLEGTGRPIAGGGRRTEPVKTLIAVACLAATALAYFSTVLGGELLLTERDLSVFFIPPRLLWVDTVFGGEFPLWNPYSFSGTPLMATLQPGIFYPVNFMLLVLPFDIAFNWSIILHFIIAGVTTLLLLRELSISWRGAMAGALTFMLTGYLFSVHNVISTLFTVSWVPLAILFFMRASRRVSYPYAAATGLTLAVMFTAGGIEVLFGTLMLLLIMAVFPSVMDPTGPRRNVPGPGITQRGRMYLAAVVVMALLSAAQLLPFLELARLSTRAGGLAYGEATTWSFAFKDFLHLFIPDPYGYGADNEKYWSNQSWLKTVYIGAIPFILGYFHLRKERFRTASFVIAGLFFLILAMGSSTFLYRFLFDHLPFFNKIRYPVKFLFVPFLFLAVAAGSGADYVSALKWGGGSGSGARRLKRLSAVFLVISTLSAIAFGLLSFFTADILAWLSAAGFDYPEYNYPAINLFNTKRVVVFLLLASLAVYLALRSPGRSRIASLAIIILLAADLFFAHRGYYAATPAVDYHKPGTVISTVKTDNDGLYRVFATPKTLREGIEVRSVDGSFDVELLKSMSIDKERMTGYNLEQRVFDVGGFGVMQRGDYAAVYTMLASGSAIDSTNLLALMNVRYVVSIPDIESDEFRLVKVIGAAGDGATVPADGDESKLLKVYENLNYLPRFFTVRDFRVITGPRDYAEMLPSKDFQPGQTVLLEEQPWPDGEPATSSTVDNRPVEVIEYRSNSMTVRADCGEEPCIMVASESWYPGWKAFVDGTETGILKADYIYRAVALGPGAHEVRFAYRPASFIYGAAISAATILGLLALAVLRFLRRGSFGI